MCVQGREGSIKHAAAHLGVAVVQSIGDKKEEERGDLRLLQVLRELIQSQGNATSERAGHRSIRRNALKFFIFNSEYTKLEALPGLPLVRWGFRNYSAQGIEHRRWSLQQQKRVILQVLDRLRVNLRFSHRVSGGRAE